MRVSPRPIREYLLCIPEGVNPYLYFSGIREISSDGEVQCIRLCTSHGKLKAQAARCCSVLHIPIGILAAPHRFLRPRRHLGQAYFIAGKFLRGHAVFFDEIAHTTEYQNRYTL